MKSILLLLVLPAAIFAADDLVCSYEKPNVPKTWIKMDEVCIKSVRTLLDQEMATATQYLALAAYHYRTDVSRPGYAEVYLESGNHHRRNCKRLINYLTMRGQNVEDIDNLLHICYKPPKTEWENGVQALTFALELESVSTDGFRHVIGVCEDQTFNDYNLVNYLTKRFLFKQYDDMKWYADELSSLLKVYNTNGQYGEFMMDVGYWDEFSP